MKIAIIGATGNVGRRIVHEALQRGHEVTAIARDPSKLSARASLKPVKGDAAAPGPLAALLKGHDAVVSAVGFQQSQPAKLIEAVRTSDVTRYLVVGGAGSLEVAPGLLLVDAPTFPAEYKPEAVGGKAFLDALKAQGDLDWSFLSPSALFVPGERTTRFRLGKDTLLADDEGKSWISYEDYAIAMLDEIETPKHVRQRFTVGY